jgi:hypothetical protein
MAKTFSTDADFVSTDDCNQETGPADTGTGDTSVTLESELATLEAIKASSTATFFGTRVKFPKGGGGYWTGSAYQKAKALQASLNTSTVSATASSSIATMP